MSKAHLLPLIEKIDLEWQFGLPSNEAMAEDFALIAKLAFLEYLDEKYPNLTLEKLKEVAKSLTDYIARIDSGEEEDSLGLDHDWIDAENAASNAVIPAFRDPDDAIVSVGMA